MSEEEIIERFNREVQLNMRLSRLIQKERDRLRKELEMWKERELQSRLHSEKLVDQNTHLLQQINLQTEMQTLRDEQKTKNTEEAGRQQEQRRSTPQQKLKDEQQQQRVETNTQYVTKGGQIQNSQDGNISGKFVFVSPHYSMIPSFLSSDNVEYIHYMKNNFDSLVHNISSYKKELLVLPYWVNMSTTSGYANIYANLLSLCREWKRLRPDGEIHCLYWYFGEDSPSEPDKELISLFTTCNKYLRTDDASRISAFRQYWPNFVDSILSEETKKEFPK